MRKTKVKFLLLFALVFLAASNSTYAQGSLDDNPEPPPAAPINQAIPLLALMGVAFAFKAFAKAS